MLNAADLASMLNVPDGFRRVAVARGQTMWVARGEDADALAEAILSPPGSAATDTGYMGRASLRGVRLSDGSRGLVRSYRHGGLFRHFSRDWFLAWPPRPFAELSITEQARQKGVLTADVVAAFVAYEWGPLYRGWLVTRELCNAVDLWCSVRKSRCTRSHGALMQRVGKAVRWMHDAGVYHADLNMRNLLVSYDPLDVYVIDFDKGRVMKGAVPAGLRRRNITRLLRSVKKLDPARHYVSAEDWRCFLVAYDE